MKFLGGRLAFTKILVSAATAAWLAAPAISAEPLRVCADPDNLPFSKAEGPERGLYVELAELVAQRLNATPVQYTWWLTHYQRRALRNTVAQGVCDAVFALPAHADYRVRGLQKTAAFLDVGYALVAAPSFQFKGLESLKGKRLAVQFQTNPHILLSQLEGFNFTTLRTSEEVFDALTKGEVEAAFLWGPIAGYENMRRHGNRWAVTPLSGRDMNSSVAVAVRLDKAGLVKDIDAALLALRPEIAALADKYGFPRGKPVDLTVLAPARRDVRTVQVPAWMVATVQQKTNTASPIPAKGTGKPDAKAATKPIAAETTATVAAAAQAPAMSESAVAGRIRFNSQCSHCHGSDAVSPLRERDLRRLKMRYDDKWLETAVTTIKNGRPDKGMPTWKDVLREDEFQQILSFLETLQK